MRKLLLFLLLLCAGLLVLWWIDRPGETPGVEERAPTAPVEGGAAPGGPGLRLGGSAKGTFYDAETKKALFTIESEDSLTESGADLLRGVRLEILDPREGVVQCRLTAASARIRRKESALEYLPDYENLVQLEGVQAEILSGAPLTPLVFHAPTAVVDALDPSVRKVISEGEFTASSPELAATGRGLFCDLDRGVLEIRERGRVELRRSGQTPAVFASTGDGPLQIRREGGPSGPLTLEAWKGAALELMGSRPARLSAQHVTARASSSDDREGWLGIERVEAEENVEWRSGDALFRAQRASATFASGGRLARARLEGLPSAQLVLELTPEVVPELPSPERRGLLVSGASTMEITWEDGFRLAIDGPASVETGDFVMKSGVGGITGWLAEDERSARFSATGGVVVEGGRATLETGSFEVAIRTGEAGRPTTLEGTAAGGASLRGALLDGRAYTLTTPEDLRIERTVAGWRVIEARSVEVSLADPGGFRARADRVHDFDVSNSRFQAEGAIAFENSAGRAGGERLEMISLEPPALRLEGTSESKAFFEGERLRATALAVDVAGGSSRSDPLSVHAQGEVAVGLELAGELAPAGERIEVAADEAFLERSEAPGAVAGERLRTWRVTAEGGVECTMPRGDQSSILRGAHLSFDLRERLAEGSEPVRLGFLLIVEGTVRADVFVEETELVLESGRLEIEASGEGGELSFGQLTASQDVRFQRGRGFGGEAELLTLDADGQGSLQALPFGQVALFGRFPSHELSYRMKAERVDFALPLRGEDEPAERAGRARWIRAIRPELRLAGHRARAEQLLADESSVALSGNVRVLGATPSNVPWTLDASEVVLVGRTPRDVTGGESGDPQAEFAALRASGGIDYRLGDRMRARGERLIFRRATGVLRLEGAPAFFNMPFAEFEAEWVEFDPLLQVLVASGRGRMRSRPPATSALGDAAPQQTEPEWSLEFLSSSMLVELDSLVFVLQEPVFHAAQFDSTLRASWAVFWLDREGMRNLEAQVDLMAGLRQAFEDLRSASKGVRLTRVLGMFRSKELSGLLREVYFEGPVEVLSEGELLARADAIYLDSVSQHGWLSRATVNLLGPFLGQDQERLVVKTDWLRLSSDGSLRADRATVTSCTFDDPHVRVVTGDLRIVPLEGQGKERFRLLLKENRIELYDWLRIPLPTIDVNTDKEFNLLWPTLSVADSARFGTLLGLSFTRPADNVGEVFNKATGHGGQDFDAHYKVDGSYLGSRGGLLDLGLEIESKQSYWFDLFLGLAYDTGDDRGFIRVDDDERDNLRLWLRSQSYFGDGKNAWSFSYTDQSDPAVQSEYYEAQFLRYERSETYGQWRRSSDEYFTQGSVKVRTDGFRTDIEELPSLSAYRGRSPILSLGRLSLIHTGDVQAAYLRRREGSEPRSPFALPTHFEDGLGDRDLLRVDTTQVLELPIPLGWGGLRFVPFVSARATGWSEGADESDSPARFLAEGGARLATNFWKRTGGSLNQIAPFVEYRSELERSDHDGQPVEFDAVEQAVTGDFLRLGARTRLGTTGGRPRFDLDLLGTYAGDRSDDRPDGWLPVEIFSRLDVEPFRQQLEFWYDARLDAENSETVYSLFSVATRFGDSWGLQAGHQFGRAADGSAAGSTLPLDPSRPVLYEAATISALYRWTEKWEFEAREAFSLLEDSELDTRLALRRYGHDIVLEIESSVREGEGSSFGLSFRPRFGYAPPRIGYVPW